MIFFIRISVIFIKISVRDGGNVYWLSSLEKFVIGIIIQFKFSVPEVRDSLLSCSGESSSIILVFFPRYFLTAVSVFFFLPRGKPLPWRAAAEIEQFERAASFWCHRKNITRDWERIFEFGTLFSKPPVNSTRLRWKKCARLFQQLCLLFSQINIFEFALACSFLLNN